MRGEGDVMMRYSPAVKYNVIPLSLSLYLRGSCHSQAGVITALLQDSILLSSPAFYTGGAAI